MVRKRAAYDKRRIHPGPIALHSIFSLFQSKNTVKLRENAANTVFNEGFRFIDDQEADGSNWILQKHIKDSAKGVVCVFSLT